MSEAMTANFTGPDIRSSPEARSEYTFQQHRGQEKIRRVVAEIGSTFDVTVSVD
jgi:hypothetical protein